MLSALACSVLAGGRSQSQASSAPAARVRGQHRRAALRGGVDARGLGRAFRRAALPRASYYAVALALPLADALSAGGVRIIEITLRTAAACAAISAAVRRTMGTGSSARAVAEAAAIHSDAKVITRNRCACI